MSIPVVLSHKEPPTGLLSRALLLYSYTDLKLLPCYSSKVWQWYILSYSLYGFSE